MRLGVQHETRGNPEPRGRRYADRVNRARGQPPLVPGIARPYAL
ncbi:hypothetical protein MBT84_11780 [Streptomyces sp. MBT84]|nr:hypothetical protein [Streptomyces sp. MBT84]